MISVTQALANALHEHYDPSMPPPRYWRGYCQMFVRGGCWKVPARDPSAAIGWREAKYKHTTGVPPAGAPVFWLGGSDGNGHVALSAGHGFCWSTDILRIGKVDNVAITMIDSAWGRLLHRVGWTEDINGYHVLTGLGGEGGGEPIGDQEMTPAEWIRMQKEIADGASRALQAWVAGETNLQFTGTEVAAIQAMGAQDGVIGHLATPGLVRFSITGDPAGTAQYLNQGGVRVWISQADIANMRLGSLPLIHVAATHWLAALPLVGPTPPPT